MRHAELGREFGGAGRVVDMAVCQVDGVDRDARGRDRLPDERQVAARVDHGTPACCSCDQTRLQFCWKGVTGTT